MASRPDVLILPQTRARADRQSALLSMATVRVAARPAAALAVIAVAYHTSLSTLFEGLSLDTPLAHLALVPVIALALVFARRRPKDEPPIHDRQLDWILGVPLVLGALAMNLFLPARLSTMYWVWRIDLLSLPFFVAGVVTLLFGTRTLWRIKAGVLFLFLAWPYPYNAVLDRWLGEFTELTITGLRQVLRAWPLASAVPGGDGSLFEVVHGDAPIRMSVASACSGANGVVGFFLVGIAFMLVVQGSRRRKITWLAVGGVLVWAFNVARITVIFYAARAWGEKVAIEGFHPYIGLVVFNIAVLVMLASMRLFGLRLPASLPRLDRTPLTVHRPKGRMALGSVLVATVALGALNSDLRNSDPIASSLGSPRLSSFAVTQETPDGWRLKTHQRIDWARRFFGSDSQWVRYIYSDVNVADGAINSNLPIYADVIDTSSRNALSAYGVEACYKFHGYKTTGEKSVDLGSGVVGGIITWSNPDTKATWTTLWWHWPIKTDNGTRYERMVLLVNDQASGRLSAPEPERNPTRAFQIDATDKVHGSAGGDDAFDFERLAKTERFLTSFAQDLVARRVAEA